MIKLKGNKRLHLSFYMTVVGLVFYTVFGLYNIFTDNTLTGVILCVFASIGLANLYLMFTKYQKYSRFILALIVFATASFLIAFGGRGEIGYLWTHPLIVFAVMVLKPSEGVIFSILFLLAQFVLVFNIFHVDAFVVYDFLFATRFMTSNLAMCCVACVLIAIQDRTDQRLETRSITDGLTGLFNRRILDNKTRYTSRLSENVKRFVLLIDIDHFKRINDTHGHAVGDAVLILISTLMKKTIRQTDIIIRWGGEEFLVIMQTDKLEIAENVADKLRTNFESSTDIKMLPCGPQTLSVGLSTIREDDNLDLAVKRADEALYSAKTSGRNKVITNI